MAINPFRKILWRFGFDFHRFRPEPNQMLWLKDAGIRTVIDIGANIGQFAEEIRTDLPDVFIYSFEPLKDCFDVLVEKMRRDEKFKAFNIGLGDADQDMSMHHNRYSPSSSLLDMAQSHKDIYPHTREAHDEKVSVRRLDDFDVLKQENPEKEILVKIDTQGYEDRIIRGGREFLKKAKVIIIETAYIPLYEKQPLFADIYKMLTEIGFTYKGPLHRKFNVKTGGNLSEDSLFVK